MSQSDALSRHALLRHELVQLDRHPDGVFWLVRSAVAADIAEVLVGAHLACLDRVDGLDPHAGLVIDSRLGPGRHEPAFESGMQRLGDRIAQRIGRTAILLATAAGALQAQRLAGPSDRLMLVTRWVTQAVAFARGGGLPSTRSGIQRIGRGRHS